MSMIVDLDTERAPLGRPSEFVGQAAVRPFGLSVARWEPGSKHERELVNLDPDSQIGYVGDRPLRELISAGTRSQFESDGQTPISLDYGEDD
ncbi:hypothetical protein [Kribbella deserti]|uniref:Uncharacterized protein n=1 Tax=Kribbella deserti TaxID=1926257 RepID=A0ABV6QP32_9ACTN